MALSGTFSNLFLLHRQCQQADVQRFLLHPQQKKNMESSW